MSAPTPPIVSEQLPHVAVLLATYNGLSWIGAQVESILAQARVRVSLIVSDDGSTDGTREWLQDLAARESAVRILPTLEPTGSSAANFARLLSDVDHGKFDYCALADQDDVWFLDKLSRAIECLTTTGKDGYSSDVMALFADGRRRLVDKSAPQRHYDHYFESPGPGCSFVLTRPLAANVGALLGELRRAGGIGFPYHDWFIYAYARRAGYRWHIDARPSLLYRQHGHNVLGANIGFSQRWSRLARIWSGWYFDEIRKLHTLLESLKCYMPEQGDALAPELLSIDGVSARLRFVSKVVPQARRNTGERMWLGLCTLTGLLRAGPQKSHLHAPALPVDRPNPFNTLAPAKPVVLHVGKLIPPPYAGIESHVDTLLRVTAADLDATLVASLPPRQTPSASDTRQELPYRIVACRTYGTVASVAVSPSLPAAVRRELAGHPGGILHVHAPNPWGDLVALQAPSNTPVVMTWHSDIVGRPALFRLYSAVQRRAVDRADRIVVFTPRHYTGSPQLQRYGVERKIVTVSIGIDFDRLERTPTDRASEAAILAWSRARPLILSVGRQVPYKGYRYLIEAMARLKSEAVLLMIGTGPLSQQLQTQAWEIGVADRIRFLGEVAPGTLATALRLCDVFTLPSVERSEAFGIASAEAMAFGKPTVVCDLQNGVNHLNREGHTSLVTPPRDVGALSSALDELVTNGPLRRAMGLEASRWVRSEFNVDRMRRETLALYEALT